MQYPLRVKCFITDDKILIRQVYSIYEIQLRDKKNIGLNFFTQIDIHILNSITIEVNAVIRPIIKPGQSFPILTDAISKLIEKFRQLSVYLIKK
jgi:hypothetical protein